MKASKPRKPTASSDTIPHADRERLISRRKREYIMTLHDLKNIIDFTFDIVDDEIDAGFYIELDEIAEEHLGIEVVKIGRDVVTCKLTDYLRRKARFHPTEISDYIAENYYDGDLKDYLTEQLSKRPIPAKHINADITDDGGEAVYHFITNDMYDFLTQK